MSDDRTDAQVISDQLEEVGEQLTKITRRLEALVLLQVAAMADPGDWQRSKDVDRARELLRD